MHHCLLVHELQLLIFSNCDPCSLGRLARTSKSFLENALDRLWRHIEFLDILELLPADLWNYKRLGRYSYLAPPKATLLRSHVPDDLVVFTQYAKRVTSVSWNTGSSKLSYSAIKILYQLIPDPIFPNLRAIWGYGYFQRRDCVVIRMFLSPKIESVSLSYLPWGGHAEELLSKIGDVIPLLKSLTLDFDTSELHRSQTVSDLVCRLNHLEDLSARHLSPRAITHIAASTTLRRIKYLRIKEADMETLPETRSTSLRDVHLVASEGPLIFVKFLSFICPSRLQHLSLVLEYSDSIPSLDEWKKCFQSLSLHCSSTLQTLVVNDTPQRSIWDRANWEMFKPLLTIGCLKHFSLQGIYHSLGDQELAMMALSWPHLASLDILPPGGGPQVTMTGLVSLLNHCPKLEALWLGIDARVVNGQFAYTCNRAITQLTVGNSPIGDPATVAFLLSKVMPNLRETKPSRGDYYEGWETVSEILKASKHVERNSAVWYMTTTTC